MATKVRIPIEWTISNQQAFDKARADLQSMGGIGSSVSDVLKNLGTAYTGGTEYIRKWVDYQRKGAESTMGFAEAAKQAQRQLSQFQKMSMSQGKGIDFGVLNEESRKIGNELNAYNKSMSDLEKSSGKGAESIRRFGEESHKSGLKLWEVTKNILKFQLIMQPIRAIMSGIISTLKDSTQVAATAEQVFNKLETVYINNSKALSVAIEQAREYGVAISTMASSLSTVGDLLQGQGMGKSESLGTAADWTKWFQDIIAFKDINMSLDEFSQNFMSGAAGNLRNFRTFGSIVKESGVNARLAAKGLDELTGSELELAKMTTRAEMALEQQKNAWGATKREWDTTLSVNRRLNESWKEWKENLGSIINENLKPMKSWLDKILTIANKVTQAQKEIKSGEYTIKIKTEKTPEDFKAMVETLKSYQGEGTVDKPLSKFEQILQKMAAFFLYLSPSSIQTGENYQAANASYENARKLTAQEVAAVSMATGYGLDEIAAGMKLIGTELTDEVRKSAQKLIDIETKRLETMSRFTDLKLVQQESAADISEYRDLLKAAFKGGTAQSWLSGDTFANKLSADYVLGRNAGTAGENVDTAIKSVVETITTFQKNIADATAKRDALQGQIKGMKAQYGSEGAGWSAEERKKYTETLSSMLLNFANYNSLIRQWTESNEALLPELKSLYEKSEKDKAVSSVDSAAGGVSSQIEEMKKRQALQLVYSDSESDLLELEMERWKTQKSLNDQLEKAGFTQDEIAERMKGFNASYDEYYQMVKAVTDEKTRQAELEARSKFQVSIADFKAGLSLETRDYRVSLAEAKSIYASDNAWKRGKIDEAVGELDKAFREGTIGFQEYMDTAKDSREAIEDEYKERKKLTAEGFWSEKADSMFGSWSGMRDSFNQGNEAMGTQFWGGARSILMDLLAQTELVAKINSVIADYMMPILDDILSPLLPFIASAIAGVVLGIKDVIDTIGGTLGWLWNNIKVFFHNLFKPFWEEKWSYPPPLKDVLEEKYEENFREYQESIDKIWGEVKELNESDEGYMQAIQQMMDSGIISDREGFSLINDKMGTNYALNMDRASPTRVGTGSVTYDSRHIIINLNGSNFTLDDIVRLVETTNAKNAKVVGL